MFYERKKLHKISLSYKISGKRHLYGVIIPSLEHFDKIENTYNNRVGSFAHDTITC